MTIERQRVVVAGTTQREIASLLPFARVLGQAQERDIHVLGLIPVPEGESLSAGARRAQRLREDIQKLISSMSIRTTVRVAHQPWGETLASIKAEENDLLLVDWKSALPADVLRKMPCELVVVNARRLPRVRNILLPIRGGPHAGLALRVALAFAEVYGAEITLLHVTPASRAKAEAFQEFLKHLRALPQVTHWINVRGNAAKWIGLTAKSPSFQLLVMGSIARPRPGDPPIGPTAACVMEEIKIPALVVRSRPTNTRLDSLQPVDYTVPVVVDKWFGENTFHAHEFEDVKRLVDLKERQGLTISLGLPTLNEEKTIGRIIRTVQTRFIKHYPLLDEVVVIDSNSTDRTVEIAEGMGVPVVKHPKVLTQYDVWEGKGEALWNSLYVLKGDLIAWIDTDIINIHPRFVYGILGPLIREPHLMYVKGFYQRPLRIGKRLETRGGGRVTELVARPLLNLFFPELSGLVQPLAGEYAGRRQALEAVPFFTGYGVEIGLLIDLWSRFGLRAIGQVDLEERVHRNQSLLALSKMAFEIMQVVMQRVGETHRVELVNELYKSMKLIRSSRDSFQLDMADIRSRERPPMITIPEYREQRGLPIMPAAKQR